MSKTKFQNRMKGVLPPEELPSFFSALESLGAQPLKSIRIRRDLGAETKWTPERFRAEGIPLGNPVPWYDHGYFFDLARMDPHPSRHPLIGAGLAFIQEAGAMEVVPELQVEPSHLVLDLCAAPGAKSSHIGEYLGRSSNGELGWLVANEPVRDRAKLLDAILARHGIANSTVYNLEPHRLAAVFPEVFDRILVDAPCSGESLFAKREEKRSDVTDKEVERCSLRQKAILANAARMLVPGGRMVYSTCAYSRTENEEVVAEFLMRHPRFSCVREIRRFPHRDGVPGGYLAVLEYSETESVAVPSREARWSALREGVRAIGDRGLVRDGLQKWDGSRDEYASVMDRRGVTDSGGVRGNSLPRQELSREEAIRFLNDPSAFAKGTAYQKGTPFEDMIYTWEGEPLNVVIQGKSQYPKARLR